MVAQGEVALGAGPDGNCVVGVPLGGGRVRLNVSLMHRLGVVLALDDNVGVLETLLHITQPKLKMVGDIGGLGVVSPTAGPLGRVGQGHQPFVEGWGIVFHGFGSVEHRRQHLKFYVQQLRRLLGQVGAVSGHRGNGVALIQSLLSGQHVAAVEAVVDGGAFVLIGYLRRKVGQISRSNHRFHSG